MEEGERNPLSRKLQRKLIALSLHPVHHEEPSGVLRLVLLLLAMIALGFGLGRCL